MKDSGIRPGMREAFVIIALFAISDAAASLAMRAYRAAGMQPFFYQTNFEPAVMMACGRGFGVSPSSPPELGAFLRLQRNTFDCALLPASVPNRPLTMAASANWYYLYGTTAAVWWLTGVSWTALDALVAVLAGIVSVLLYGLFRLVSGRAVAAGLTLLLTLSPANLRQLPALRDYSKAPFVLAAILILAVLVLRPMRRSMTLAMAGSYGAVVGFGYGFRGDLAVMVPFGTFVVLVLLPGSFRANVARNVLAPAVLLAVFLLVAWPVLSGLDRGGCQFHFALLGLTEPATTALHLSSPLYRFGDHALDIFDNLKVGDYAWRVMHAPVPTYCDADFDTASGQLYMKMATTFPADFVVRAYGSVLMILRQGLAIPEIGSSVSPSHLPSAIAGVYQALASATSAIAPAGVALALIGIAAAFALSARLGAALAVFVLFLTGYPAIRFEERHWFHLRFIPWWAAAMVGGLLLKRGVRGWRRPELLRAAMGSIGLLIVLALALGTLRVLQVRNVRALITAYTAAATEAIPIDRENGSFFRVHWQPRDYGPQPEHRGADLVVVTLEPSACGEGDTPISLMIKYDFDSPAAGHDLSTTFTLARPKVGDQPTRVFVPVFWAGLQDQTFLRFSGVQVAGAPGTCVRNVARVNDGGSLPLWLDVQVPADWSEERLYQTIEPPPHLKWLFKRPL